MFSLGNKTSSSIVIFGFGVRFLLLELGAGSSKNTILFGESIKAPFSVVGTTTVTRSHPL